jgi:hypothetical protein
MLGGGVRGRGTGLRMGLGRGLDLLRGGRMVDDGFLSAGLELNRIDGGGSKRDGWVEK